MYQLCKYLFIADQLKVSTFTIHYKLIQICTWLLVWLSGDILHLDIVGSGTLVLRLSFV